MLVICPHCKPVDESKQIKPRAQAIGVGVPKKHFKKHMELIHGLVKRG